jgi:hypothetical protein
MSSKTSICFYPKKDILIDSALISATLLCLEPQANSPWFLVFRAESRDRAWDDHLDELRSSDEPTLLRLNVPKYSVPRCSLGDVASHYVSSEFPLTADAMGANFRLQSELTAEIDSLESGFRKDFEVSNSFFVFGEHDIFSPATELRDPEFFRRANVSLQLWGYRTPHLVEFPIVLGEMVAVKKIRMRLEAIWGETDFQLISLTD